MAKEVKIEWHSVKEEGLPKNANTKGEFCPRYLVSIIFERGTYTTEGWFNPDTNCWFVLFWFLSYEKTSISMERGDKPNILRVRDAKGEYVTAWAELPEPYKEEENEQENRG